MLTAGPLNGVRSSHSITHAILAMVYNKGLIRVNFPTTLISVTLNNLY